MPPVEVVGKIPSVKANASRARNQKSASKGALPIETRSFEANRVARKPRGCDAP
jgi:hypothetical protein